ncbi:interleukin-17F-like [Nothobranchius furzeri]|uniref:Interleukin-17F-like n=1 Tax=Nothobranchius furzeri TaxID=105023 RepID=A0A9D2Y0Z7_NOTFU|nr:interleukin-17F-like [Nothobranchius furzeri]
MSVASISSRITLISTYLTMTMMMMMMMTPAAAKPHGRTFEEQTVPLRLDPNDLVPSTKITSLENTSISPWTYNISRDDSLFPNVLSEANCLLQGCLNLRGQEDLNLQSRPIMHQVLVLRRVKTADAGQGYHYRLESRLVAVGCTCVRPIVHIQH